ncbi:MAG TPA: nickel pincer cofactor biosynthesis protein LarB [Propionibacteriaceae bacterium]|nr:nickel pincer cofactor biosynthesis protein LarB [Propionibacteriaceae bacterium]
MSVPDRQPDPLEGVATLDLHRARRRGYPEAVYCEGKTLEHVEAIARSFAGTTPEAPVLFTRADADKAAAVLRALPDARHDPVARLVVWPPAEPAERRGSVLVVTAGTSDIPVAREAALTATYLGCEVGEVTDVGVAGLHRILGRLEQLRTADVVIVVAGMDGALPSVVAGLVECPVVAVPTSVGYGAAFGGLAPLLTMLNSCSPGIGVVNIDNGYGAAHLAAQIARGKGH